jgi:uncharacterized OB-fold protein
MMAEGSFTKADFDHYLAEGKLMGSKCKSCGAEFLPPRPMCPECFSGEMEWVEMGSEGELAAYTVVNIASTAMIEAGYGRENPHCSGLVKLGNGQVIAAQILGVDPTQPEKAQIGDKVKLEIVDRGQDEAAIKALAFRLVE